MSKAINKARSEIVEKLKASLGEGVLPWDSPFLINDNFHNVVSNSEYRGVNRFILLINSIYHKYTDPRFCTFKQAANMGWKIKKGSKGIPIEFWSMYDSKTKKNISLVEYKDLIKSISDKNEIKSRFRSVSMVYTVFNAQQIEGIPALEKNVNNVNDTMIDKWINEYAKSTNLVINSDPNINAAFYNVDADEIKVATIERFKSSDQYYSTLLHECAHSTGAVTRLNRDWLHETTNKTNYAKEELRAEISASFLCNQVGIVKSSETAAAYIQSWLQIIEHKESEFFVAVKDADKISEYILEKGNYKELETQQQLEAKQYKEELELEMDIY